MTDPEAMIETLSPGLRRAIMVGFAGGFWTNAQHGMAREWPDIIQQTGGARSHRNTIVPLIKRGLAEKVGSDYGTYRLTALGLIIRDKLATLAPDA